MREIEFRGYVKYKNKWIYGMLEKSNLTNRYTICNMQDGVSYLVNELSISQYTGFTDATGNKIFEGDILSSIYNPIHTYTIMWSRGCWVAKDTHDLAELFLSSLGNDMQVVGNIYDEKLKEEKQNVANNK